MEALQGQVQHLQDAFSQYKKGEFLGLNWSWAPRLGWRLGLGLGLELVGLRLGLGLRLE